MFDKLPNDALEECYRQMLFITDQLEASLVKAKSTREEFGKELQNRGYTDESLEMLGASTP